MKTCALAVAFLASLPSTPGLSSQVTAPSAAATNPLVRLTILGDNAVARGGVKAVWGFACLVEAQGHTVLFETGVDPAVLTDNLAALKVNPARIDAIVLSHYHGDHAWGVPGLGTLPGIVPVLQQVKRQTDRPLHFVIGGFHLLDQPEAEVRRIATSIQAMGVAQVSATHCTGEAAAHVFRDVFGDRYMSAGVGAVIDLPFAARGNDPALAVEPAGDRIQAEGIRAHLEFLADDLLEGRATGSRGHRLAVNYIRAQCQAAGLRGAGEDGGYFQDVPLVRTLVEEAGTTLELKSPDKVSSLGYGTDFALLDTHRDTEGSVSTNLVFVGYGVTAPEQGYDDYAGLDVTGKIVVLLSFEAPPSFPSSVRAYFAHHEVKRSNAAAHGAIGALYIRSPATEARFPWAAVLRELRVGGGSLRWLQANGRPSGLDDSVKVFGCLNRSGAEALFADEHVGLAEIVLAIEKGTPPRFALSKSATVKFRSRHEKVEGQNVVAVLEGCDPLLKNEHVLFTAHVDHLGIGDPVNGDSIYNGALDNAAGCAVLLEVARAFAAAPERAKRSLLFLFVTAEEAGLLGSDYFACNPVLPGEQIVADINLDGGTFTIPLSDVIAWGAEHSSLQTPVQSAARRIGFTVTPDPYPEEGIFVRTDAFSFVKKGIPSVYVEVGVKSPSPGVDALALWKQWLVTTYHSPKDDLSQPIDYETGSRFARFVFCLGRAIAMDPERPHWNENDFFGGKFSASPR